MNGNLQSGKTQAIDLDELHVQSANRPTESRPRGEFELDKWGDDPWSSTEESRSRRRWADDEKWAGDDEEQKQRPEDQWDVEENQQNNGWHAPKRGDVLEASEGWDDWNNFGGAPKELEQELESKENGGYRRVQAASQYAQVDNSDYVDGRAQREDLYRSKEGYGTAGIRERHGDPYANRPQQMQQIPMPAMQPVSTWGDEEPAGFGGGSSQQPANSENREASAEDDMRASAKIANQNSGVDDIPGVTRASIIIFQADTEPVVYELKKISTTIGRGLDNMVILNDQYASRKHLVINYVSGRFELFALSPDNLATVNGYPISHIVLMNGDQIEVGATRIRFVLGPISDEMMQLSAPVNGRPLHIDPPPQETRSPKTTRKNLILLIAAVSVVVVFLIVTLIVMAAGGSEIKDEVASNDNDQDGEIVEIEDADPAQKPEEAPKAPEVKLPESDDLIVNALAEAIGGGVNHHSRGEAELHGKVMTIRVKTDPEGARIYNADGSLRGTTPYDKRERVDEAGSRSEKWTIRLDGYKDYKLEAAFPDAINETIVLEPDVPAPAAKPAPKKKPSGGGKKGGGKKSGGGGGKKRILL